MDYQSMYPQQQPPAQPQEQDFMQVLLQSMMQPQQRPDPSAYGSEQADVDAILNQVANLDRRDLRSRGILGYFGRKSRGKKRDELMGQYKSELAQALAEKNRFMDAQSRYDQSRNMQNTLMSEYVKQQFAPKSDNRPDWQKKIEYLQSLPPEQQQKMSFWLGLEDRPKVEQPKMGTANIAGQVVPTVDGVPQTDKPYGMSESAMSAENKRKEKQDEKISGQNVLTEKMRSFANMLTNDRFSNAVGPYDSSGVSRFFGGLANTKDSQILRQIDRLAGQEVLDLGARVLKGSQTEGEWARVSETMPSDKDHPEVWYSWYDDALKTLMAGAPETVAALDPLRQQLYDFAAKSGSKWDRVGTYVPYAPSQTGDVNLPPGFELDKP